ncbi:hypothetical protein YYC_05523 [Plasmodium yoelii 17X]|uniref:Uncharacterized protein n=2 Tax=Plasmodium yoelii TaxID=5861 RepID=Q7RD78_PLAYO|nr:hypothetical protein [Plasmodium yoelii yoelii]ETB56484.1 hypothetical protein YYC_05523 [Plasmodium yoelii 17X]
MKIFYLSYSFHLIISPLFKHVKLISVSKLNQTRHINLEKILLLMSSILSPFTHTE